MASLSNVETPRLAPPRQKRRIRRKQRAVCRPKTKPTLTEGCADKTRTYRSKLPHGMTPDAASAGLVMQGTVMNVRTALAYSKHHAVEFDDRAVVILNDGRGARRGGLMDRRGRVLGGEAARQQQPGNKRCEYSA